MKTQKDIYLFIGPPGSGKGSLSSICVKNLGWHQLSTGNLCRQHIAEQTEIGKQIDFAIKSGKLVSDSLVTDMVEQWLTDAIEKAPGIILDGFPRTTNQAQALHGILSHQKFSSAKLVIIKLVISDELIVARLAGRYICNNNECQKVYSLINGSSLQPKQGLNCDECSGLLVRRSDDSEESVRERLRNYYAHESDLLKFYANLGQRIDSIDVARSLDIIFSEFNNVFLSGLQ